MSQTNPDVDILSNPIFIFIFFEETFPDFVGCLQSTWNNFSVKDARWIVCENPKDPMLLFSSPNQQWETLTAA